MRSDKPTAACGLHGILLSVRAARRTLLWQCKAGGSPVVYHDARWRPVIECVPARRLALRWRHRRFRSVATKSVPASLPRMITESFSSLSILGVSLKVTRKGRANGSHRKRCGHGRRDPAAPSGVWKCRPLGSSAALGVRELELSGGGVPIAEVSAPTIETNGVRGHFRHRDDSNVGAVTDLLLTTLPTIHHIQYRQGARVQAWEGRWYSGAHKTRCPARTGSGSPLPE
jgi:hypothetical protein